MIVEAMLAGAALSLLVQRWLRRSPAIRVIRSDARLGQLGEGPPPLALPAAREPFMPIVGRMEHDPSYGDGTLTLDEIAAHHRAAAARHRQTLGEQIVAIIDQHEAELGPDAVPVDPLTGRPRPQPWRPTHTAFGRRLDADELAEVEREIAASTSLEDLRSRMLLLGVEVWGDR